MLFRLIAGAGLFAFGYYLGKQIGRMEPIRDELEQARRERDTQAGESVDDTEDDSGH